MNATRFVRYGTSVETPAEDEQTYLDEIVATMRSVSERLGDRYRHAVRSAAYAMSSGYRHAQNVRAEREPRDASEFFALEGAARAD